MSVGIVLLSLAIIAVIIGIWLHFTKRSAATLPKGDKKRRLEDEPFKVAVKEELSTEELPVKKPLTQEVLTPEPVKKAPEKRVAVKKVTTKKVLVAQAPAENDLSEMVNAVKKALVTKDVAKEISAKKAVPKKTTTKKPSSKKASLSEEPLTKAPQINVIEKKMNNRVQDEILDAYMDLHASGSKGGVRAMINVGIGRLTEDSEVMEVLDEIERRVGKNVLGDDAYTTIYEYGFVKFFKQIDIKTLTELGVDGAIDQMKDDASYKG